MSNTIDTPAKDSDGHDYGAGVNPEDQHQLRVMVENLRKKRSTEVFGIFATVGAAAVAAGTLKGAGFEVCHNVLAVRARYWREP